MKTIILSNDELNILGPLAEYNKTIDWFIKSGKHFENKKMVISIDESKCEEVRTILTELLAKIGFDKTTPRRKKACFRRPDRRTVYGLEGLKRTGLGDIRKTEDATLFFAFFRAFS